MARRFKKLNILIGIKWEKVETKDCSMNKR